MAEKKNVMTFDKYIDNPSGGSSVFTNRQLYKTMYKTKFDKVLVREQGKIDYTVYRSNDGEDSYYIHMKIPSEVIEDFYYDVVVRLFTKSNAHKSDVRLREYKVQFYSNDPAFVYTHAHAFAKNNLFIDDLKTRMARQSLSTTAKEKNPKDNVWYVKSIYFAYLTMEKYNLFFRPMLNQNAVKYSKRTLVQNVEPAMQKVKARQDAQVELDKKKAKERLDAAKEYDANRNQDIKTKSATNVKLAPRTKTTKTTRTVKTTKKI